MLKRIRIGLALISISLITLLFLDATDTVRSFSWLAKLQLIPALLGGSLIALIILIAMTLLFGRVYCSILCPLGIMQDIIVRFGRFKSKKRYHYLKPIRWLQYSILGLFVVSFFLGIGFIVALLDPYAAYGRIATNFGSQAYVALNNIFATWAENRDSTLFYTMSFNHKTTLTLIVSGVTLLVIMLLALINGRIYCTTVCPAGTLLGFLSKHSLLKPVLDVNRCNGCKVCAMKCKSSCIDPVNHVIDYSRCVVCMDCTEACKQGAIKYIRQSNKGKVTKLAESEPEQSNESNRRRFLSLTALLAIGGTLKAQDKIKKEIAILKEKEEPKRVTPLSPPGSHALGHFTRHCTACGLCISGCPNNLLSPSTSLSTLMQPVMSYRNGYCRPECVSCSELCPTGAIGSITKEEKSSIQIGQAKWIRKRCIVLIDDVDCGNCARHCPSDAIEMVLSDPKNEQSRKIPSVNSERCIGCGACEYLCPARPLSAIYVEGVERHRTV